MTTFYVHSQTNEKLKRAERIVIAIGGYNGYGFNWGDVLQLKGIIAWYRQYFPYAVLCPCVHLWPVMELEKHGMSLRTVFGVEDWIFYVCDGEQIQELPDHLNLEPLQFRGHESPVVLHIYGGGFFNGFWGRRMLDVIEATLNDFPVDYYILSGQQVGVEFAPILADHCRRYKPDLVGCRDKLSVCYLNEHGIEAVFTSDDALEEMFRYAQLSQTCEELSIPKPVLGLHLNLSTYARASPSSPEQVTPVEEVLAQVERILADLIGRFGPSSTLLLVGAFLDPRLEVHDTWLTIKTTALTRYFPRFLGIDLPGALFQNKLVEILPLMRCCDRFLGTSYHVTFFMKILRVPSFLLAFNDYYKQKRAGIDLTQRSLQEFLSTDAEVLIEEQENIVKLHCATRQEYLEKLKDILSTTPKHLATRKTLFLAARLTEQEKALERLEEEKEELLNQVQYLQEQNALIAEELIRSRTRLTEQEKALERLEEEKEELLNQVQYLQEQNALIAEELIQSRTRLTEQEKVLEYLKARLELIEGSRAWKAIQAYWNLTMHPFWRVTLWPVRILARLFWR